jgi:DNA repair protein RadA/Sms
VQAIVPKANKPKQAISGIEVVAVERVDEAVAKMR